VQEVIDFVKKSGGIDYTINIMERFVEEALTLLEQFPDSAYKSSLREMVAFTINREK